MIYWTQEISELWGHVFLLGSFMTVQWWVALEWIRRDHNG